MQTTPSIHRPPAALLALGGAALMLLLAAHPEDHGHIHSFADVVDFEIQHCARDALVHGGAIAVLVLLLAGHVELLRATRSGGTLAVLAVTAFGAGCAFLTATLVLDGFLTPVLAGQFRAAPEGPRQEAIEAFMHACGSGIGILMRMGLLSFGASALAWCLPLVRAAGRGCRLVGALGGAGGALLGAVVLWAPPALFTHVVMSGTLLLSVWQLALARLIWRGAVS